VDNPYLHVVFGSSPAGILRRALYELDQQDKVLDILDVLNVGPISTDNPAVRGEWLNSELGEYDWRAFLRKDAKLPMKSIQHKSRLIAWYAPNRADSYAGFQWWLSQIDKKAVFIMSVPDLHFQGTDAMESLVGQEIELSVQQRGRHQAEWRALKNENAPLRIVQDGSLVSAPIDYFDKLILEFVSSEWRTAMRVVGDACHTISIETGHFIGDLFTFSRLRALSRSGVVEWYGDISDRCGSKVRLAAGDSSA
jgi:hypothetical protein